MVKVPLRPPPALALLPAVVSLPKDLDSATVRAVSTEYLHWDDVFHRSPPAGLTTEQWWALLKFQRRMSRKPIPLRSTDGGTFWFTMPDAVHELLLRIDQQLAGRIAANGPGALNPGSRDRYLVSSLTEEAITSSQLEGAATTRAAAKEMLRTGRPPRTHGEQMILNNFRAMRFIREHQDDPLTPELVCEIQRIVTEDTLDDPADAGRLQQPDETRVWVSTAQDDVLLHRPPPAEELPKRLAEMCRFANGGGTGFVHPVLRAVLLHFWLAYDHPFADGNGRTARALFYWSMLHQGYWLTEFITISTILRKAPSKYLRSFLLTETDENDATYFLLYHLDVIRRAIAEFNAYVERKTKEVRATEQFLREAGALNHRQLALISHALRNPDASYTIESHRNSHNVVYQTARTDLLDLVERGLLTQVKSGKAYRFTPAPNLEQALRDA
ncbi:MAG TPA: Fic family protein [Frankiaceae bacterium]|nr:Fic family protein [Frankiaceae bacterium]